MTSCGDETVVVPLQPTSEVDPHLVPPPVARETPHTLGSSSPVRLGMPEFLLSNVSQKITWPPNCRPQLPATGSGVGVGVGGVTTVLFAEQVAVVPLLEPAQDQVKGPVPLTDEVEPVVQRLVVGAVETVVPFADPQAPLIGVEEVPIGAEHTAFTPPLVPAQLQLKAVLVLLKALALPVEQRLAVGAVEVIAPLALPQAPLILGITGADTPGRVL